MIEHPTKPKQRLRIWQQNTNRSLEAQLDLLHSLTPSRYSIAAIQEPHIDFLGNSRATPHWYTVYPPNHCDNPKATRSLLLISKNLTTTNTWTQIPINSPDITAIRLDSNLRPIYIYNIYNDGMHPRNLKSLEVYLHTLTNTHPETRNAKMIWVGDFNRHHPLWDEDRNLHLFTSSNLDAAQPLLNLLAANNMRMAHPKGIPTLEAMNTKNYTRPDNIFCLSELLGAFISCNTEHEMRPLRTDHLPIISVLDTELPSSMPSARPTSKR